MLAGFQEKLKYDLIVFQFGLNVLGPTQTDYRYFEIKILKLIQHFQQAFPGVPILIIGPPDKCNGPAILPPVCRKQQNKEMPLFSV